MKVSVNWLNQFTDITLSVDELTHKIGTQLGAIEEVIDLGKKYQGVVIAKVISCEKHPNADKLNICMIDDGGVVQGIERDEAGLVRVVCGAPNVREGLSVAWLPPGSTVPSTFDKDPFELGSRELRGVMSNGMLASASELAISDDHNGIVELEIDAAPGSSFAEVYQLNDYIIDIENKMFTHRPDCFGILGVAREIAGIQQKPFVSPDWYTQALDRIKPGATKLPLTAQNNVLDFVPRFMAVAMADVTVKPSPFMLQTYLSRVGLRPINNIVDMTNYLMMLTGQPLHAYDADKLQKYGDLSLETRMSRPGDKLALLNGKNIELKDDTTVLITSNDIPVGIAGVMGGSETEVDETTKNIVIECANFDMYSVRRTSMKYGLFTDAVTRFNKGQSHLQNERVIEEAVALTQSLSGAHVASTVVDLHQDITDNPSVKVTAPFINSRLGIALSIGEITQLLKNVECTLHANGDELIVIPPFWRTDLQIPEDIVEEIGRLYGLDRIPLTLPSRDFTPVQPNSTLELKKHLRSLLAQAGANEVLTYGFVHKDLLNTVGQDTEIAFKINNAISPELQCYRLSLTPSLLEKVHPNIKAGFNEFVLFEIGKTHAKTELAEDGLPKEFERLSLVLATEAKLVKSTKAGAPYYEAKKYAETIFRAQNSVATYVSLAEFDVPDHKMFHQMLAPFEPARSAIVFVDDKLAGVVGEYKKSVRKALKLPDFAAGFEVFLSPLKVGTGAQYVQISKFPSVQQDITLRVPTATTHQVITDSLVNAINLPANATLSLSAVDVFQKSDELDVKQATFRITMTPYERTLTSAEVNEILDTAAEKLRTTIDAIRI